jgi:hypothetical protein
MFLLRCPFGLLPESIIAIYSHLSFFREERYNLKSLTLEDFFGFVREVPVWRIGGKMYA